MKPSLQRLTGVFSVCAALLILETSCATVGNFFSTTRYNESAYQTAKSVKEKSLALIDKARGRTAYADFAKEDNRLMQEFDSAIASEKQRAKNQPTVGQWQILKSQMRRFLDLWKKKGELSPNEEIDEDEFRELVETQKDLAKMEALRKTSAGQQKVENFRDAALNLIVKAAIIAALG